MNSCTHTHTPGQAYLPRLKVGDVSAVFPVEWPSSLFAVLQVVQGVGHSVHSFVHTVVVIIKHTIIQISISIIKGLVQPNHTQCSTAFSEIMSSILFYQRDSPYCSSQGVVYCSSNKNSEN